MIDLSPCIHLHSRSFLLILLAAVCVNGCSEDSKGITSPQDLSACTSDADCVDRLDGLTQCDIINRVCVAPQAPAQQCANDIDCAALHERRETVQWQLRPDMRIRHRQSL